MNISESYYKSKRQLSSDLQTWNMRSSLDYQILNRIFKFWYSSVLSEFDDVSHTTFNLRIMSKLIFSPRQTSNTSSRTQSCHWGCEASNIKHHVAVTEVVSWPAKYKFLQLSTMKVSAEPRSEFMIAEPSMIDCNRSFADDSEECSMRSLTIFEISALISWFNFHILWVRWRKA